MKRCTKLLQNTKESPSSDPANTSGTFKY